MFHTKLAELREARRAGSGFTLIELLVVVVILVALAAIAIPVFLNQKAKADDAAAKSSVAAVAAFVSAGIADGSLNLTTSDPATLAGLDDGAIAADGVLYSATGNIGTGNVTGAWSDAGTKGDFCVAYGGWAYANTTGGVVEGSCTGAAIAATP